MPKTAIITGASSGLGREIAMVFAENGINCVLAARSTDKLTALREELTQKFGGDHLAVPADLSSAEDVKSLFRKTAEHYAGLDVVINNAGDTYLWPLAQHSEEKIQKLISLLVTGNTLMHRFAIQNFKEYGGKGIILDVLSSAAQEALPHNPVYGAGKEYMRALSLRNELDEPGITFIRLYPSNIRTPLVNQETASPEVWESIKKGAKLEPRTVAKVVLALTLKGKPADVFLKQDGRNIVVEALEFLPPRRIRLHDLE